MSDAPCSIMHPPSSLRVVLHVGWHRVVEVINSGSIIEVWGAP
jgi:hypothetical protein